MNEVEKKIIALKLLMFEQNGVLVLSIRTHNPPNPPLPTLEVGFRIPNLDPEIGKGKKKIIHQINTTV